jgi:hypothetical protein
MYSPKIPDRFIPVLYRLGRAKGQPMTRLVAEAVEAYLASQGLLPKPVDVGPDEAKAA